MALAAKELKWQIQGWMATVDAIRPSVPTFGLKYLKRKLAQPFKREAKFATPDPRPSRDFLDASVDARHRSGPVVATVDVEVLAAGGWCREGVGDALSAEDCFAILVVDGAVARTSTVPNQKVPCWGRDDRRAFRIDVCDPGATLFVGVYDEDPNPLDPDDKIGRCAVSLRALAPNALYDAWFPLTLRGDEGEALAAAARALVVDRPMATASEFDATQAKSRGAVRLRLKVAWRDDAACARSVLRDLAKPRETFVRTPQTPSGDHLRENVRFAMYGRGGCPADPCNEPFSSHALADHADELIDLVASAIARVAREVKDLTTYARPLRSLTALVAWLSCVANAGRVAGWVLCFVAWDLIDALGAAGPAVARPQLPFTNWLRAALGLGFGLAPREAAPDVAFALGAARAAAEESLVDAWRKKRYEASLAVVDRGEETTEHDSRHVEGEPMKRFRSLHPLAGWLRPVQKGLLAALRPLRVAKAVWGGRDDPVANATVAFVALVLAAASFLYSELAHGYVVVLLAKLWTASCYAAGVALFGPQNVVFERIRARARTRRLRAKSVAGFDRDNMAALRVQECFRSYQRKLLERAAEAKARVAAMELAERERRREERRAEQAAARQKVESAREAADVAKADSAALVALRRRLGAGPIRASRVLAFGHRHAKVLAFEAGDATFVYACPETHLGAALGGHDRKCVPVALIEEVSLVDARKPRLLKFATTHKKFVFECDDARDCRLLVDALNAAAARDGTAATANFRRLAVPAKPLAAVCAALLERSAARPEVARSTVGFGCIAEARAHERGGGETRGRPPPLF